MGIDILNLVTQIERSFSMQIPDRRIQTMSTVGELHDYILDSTPIAPAGTCLTASAFLELESGIQTIGLAEHFGPSSRLAEKTDYQTLAGRDFGASICSAICGGVKCNVAGKAGSG